MSFNLLIWKWSSDLDTLSKKRKHKMDNIASAFAERGDHPAIGEADFSEYLQKVSEKFGDDELNRPFVIENYNKAVVFNYGSESRLEIVPILGWFAKMCDFNATEF